MIRSNEGTVHKRDISSLVMDLDGFSFEDSHLLVGKTFTRRLFAGFSFPLSPYTNLLL